MIVTPLRTGELVFIRGEARIKGYAAWHRHDERLPAVLIIHDVQGLSEHYRDIARRFAQEGFFALALDLYSREGAPEIPNAQAAFQWLQGLNDRRLIADIDGAVRLLRTRPEVRSRSIGVVGFCMGGRYASMAACMVENLAACVSFYGMLRTEGKAEGPLTLAPELRCPYLGLFGEQDSLIPRTDIRELESLLRRAGKTFNVKIYQDAGHAFFNDQRPESYRPDAAKDAWHRTISFLRTNLNT